MQQENNNNATNTILWRAFGDDIGLSNHMIASSQGASTGTIWSLKHQIVIQPFKNSNNEDMVLLMCDDDTPRYFLIRDLLSDAYLQTAPKHSRPVIQILPNGTKIWWPSATAATAGVNRPGNSSVASSIRNVCLGNANIAYGCDWEHDKHTSDNEIWKLIPGYDGYEASTEGNIRNHLGRILLGYDASGYRKCCGNVFAKGTTYVHVLIALTFIGPRPLLPGNWYVRHKDGQLWNNKVTNLEWSLP